MESSTEEQRNREETYNLYSPCYFFEQVIKAFLKCLGQDSTTTEDPPLHAERETKATEDHQFAVNATRSSMASRRPPRPPISSGGGGQINQSSS
ncbi:uncharacterized protein LOC133856939 [Alnus glutinosa]|uniref:uncharacterized protein LOC133856939 n=1 Tax=Alnus glutinosa TaxID=3517 RepID=UPI002D79C163|nr:uncharacterized protein LOC133856939 [Alnus glutinosa]